jgi:spore coat polysaccharide biosynthesis protein SpsF
MRIVAIVQARVQSTRLPGKVLLPLKRRPVISHILERLTFCDKVTDAILAIPDDEENTVLRKFALSAGIEYVPGPHEDVLARYLKAVEASEADIIVRVTGDSPLLSPYIADITIESLLEGGIDYAVARGTPLGIEAEVLTRDAFDRVIGLADNAEMKEHPTLAVYAYPEKFKVRFIAPPAEYCRPEFRLTLDTKEDYVLVKAIYDNVEPRQGYIRLPDVFAYLDANPALASANRDVEQRMHDYLTSSKEAISNAGHPDGSTPD